MARYDVDPNPSRIGTDGIPCLMAIHRIGLSGRPAKSLASRSAPAASVTAVARPLAGTDPQERTAADAVAAALTRLQARANPHMSGSRLAVKLNGLFSRTVLEALGRHFLRPTSSMSEDPPWETTRHPLAIHPLGRP